MSTNKTLDLLVTQYEVVQKFNQDSNTKIFQLWLGLGAIITATGALIVTNQPQLILVTPLLFVYWFYILGMTSFDNLYRAIYLAYLEQRINQETGEDQAIFTYESFASAQMWRFNVRGQWGIPTSVIWVFLNNFLLIVLYCGICLYAIQLQQSEATRVLLALGYSIPMLAFLVLTLIVGPRQLRSFSKSLREHQISIGTIVD